MAMNINLLVTVLFLALGGIYFFFKPMKIYIDTSQKEMPLLELRNFSLYEFDTTKLADFSTGKRALKYIDRYELFDFLYNEKAQQNKIISISAKKGVDKNRQITLEKDVRYVTSDGVEFTTQKALYDRNKEFAKAQTPYVASIQKNIVYGDTLNYDLKKRMIRSKNVRAIYHLNGK